MEKEIHKHKVEIKGKGENEVLLINGQEEQFIKSEGGYTLIRNAYVEPSASLEKAVDRTLEVEQNPGVDTYEAEPQDQPPAIDIRRDFLSLSSDERSRLASALNQLFDDGVIDEFSGAHEDLFVNGIHRGPAFLPWHRWYLLQLEGRLKAIDNTLTIPYWDWSHPNARSLEAEPFKSFFGGRANTNGQFDNWNYFRRSGPAGNVLPSLVDIIGEIDVDSYVDFRAMEWGSHVPGHTWTGGTMQSGRSPSDPLFFLHHCMVDRMWALWQLNHPQVEQYSLNNTTSGGSNLPTFPGQATFVPLNEDMVTGNIGPAATPASMLNRTYRYPKDARLETQAAASGLQNFISGDE